MVHVVSPLFEQEFLSLSKNGHDTGCESDCTLLLSSGGDGGGGLGEGGGGLGEGGGKGNGGGKGDGGA